MKDSSMTTELDDILMSIEDSSEDICFYLNTMKTLELEIPEYTPKEAALIKKSQQGTISEVERKELETILANERKVLDNQEDMVKSFLAQCNRSYAQPRLNLH